MIDGLATNSVPLACPRCREPVTLAEASYSCRRCAIQYSVTNSVVDFRTKEHYWNIVGEEAMLRAVDTARQSGWQAAARAMWSGGDEYLGWVMDEDRARFERVLPITPSSVVLDLGAGWGAISCGLARRCTAVAALDSNPHTLAFIGVRASQEGLNNIVPVCADPLGYGQLPYADNTFDLALLNGVLEWVGSANESPSPGQAQRACLAEIRRVLKPGGSLYIGIENRYGIGYFFGERDHSGLRYTSLLPRALASLICRAARMGRYRWYTYTYSRYRSLFRDSGYIDGKGYVVFPSYRQPRIILDADDPCALAAGLRAHLADIRSPRRRRLAQRLAALARYLPRLIGSSTRALSHSYIFVVKKPI